MVYGSNSKELHYELLYPYCAQDTITKMHSRDITLLIVNFQIYTLVGLVTSGHSWEHRIQSGYDLCQVTNKHFQGSTHYKRQKNNAIGTVTLYCM